MKSVTISYNGREFFLLYSRIDNGSDISFSVEINNPYLKSRVHVNKVYEFHNTVDKTWESRYENATPESRQLTMEIRDKIIAQEGL
ncbi:MAG TPA: hypothetical protein VN721_05300 [Flavipsychrobacter sp.]|nr:hypothetical protein [Flavipsychrobacter sp.]